MKTETKTNDYKIGDRLEWKHLSLTGHINSMVVVGLKPLTVRHQWTHAVGTVLESDVQPYNPQHG